MVTFRKLYEILEMVDIRYNQLEYLTENSEDIYWVDLKQELNHLYSNAVTTHNVDEIVNFYETHKDEIEKAYIEVCQRIDPIENREKLDRIFTEFCEYYNEYGDLDDDIVKSEDLKDFLDLRETGGEITEEESNIIIDMLDKYIPRRKLMEKHLIKMPSIGQYNQTVKDLVHHARYQGQDENDEPIYDRNVTPPKVTFNGTVKLHGTNASVCFNGKEIWAQSKGNIITPEKDNAGFANFIDKYKAYFTEKLELMVEDFDLQEVTVYGEWAGKGIQKAVGISEIEKSFFPFGIKMLVNGEDEARWVTKPQVVLNDLEDPDKNIYSIFNFETFEIEIDFNKPKDVQNKLLEITDKVEQLCPVSDAFDVQGIGEGVVYVGWYKDQRFVFKVKGEKHANSKVKTLAPVDEVKENAKREFANYACPAWRLEQAFQETFDTLNGGKGDISGTGNFLRAVIADVMKEEKDKLHEMNLEPKEVNGVISKVARTWFMDKLDDEIMNG